MSFLILTKEQADAVRGETVSGHALEPVELEDGTFALPDRVLADRFHAKKLSVLSKFQKVASVQVKEA